MNRVSLENLCGFREAIWLYEETRIRAGEYAGNDARVEPALGWRMCARRGQEDAAPVEAGLLRKPGPAGVWNCPCPCCCPGWLCGVVAQCASFA